jgi:zinc transport system substrate-binding protein
MNKNVIRKKSVILVLISILLSTLFLSGCTNTSNNKDQLSVVVTIIPQEEMVKEIGGNYVDVSVMVPAGESPHSYEPTPEQIIEISQSAAYFTVGSGVEFELTHLDTITEQNRELTIYDCSKNIDVLSFDQHYGQENYQKTPEKDRGGTDPHIWTSPVNYKQMATVVLNGLIELDPSHQEVFNQNYQEYITEIDALHENISSLLSPYKGNSFMVYHPSWGYFGDTYQLKQIAIEDEGKQPGPSGIAAIIDQAKNESISVIFVSPQFDTSSAETIAQEIGGEVASVNPLMTDYSDTLQTLAATLVNGYS